MKKIIFLLALAGLILSCSFDYGEKDEGDTLPDIIMENVEYVRMRSSEPQVRFLAETVERYEDLRIMDLQNFSFEQYGSSIKEINAYGRAGSASIEIDSMDLRLDDGVRIEVDSEDIAIETKWLEWKDKDKKITGGDEEEVHIIQDNGTSFSGIGFHADARLRSWEFSGGVWGTYYHEDDEEEDEDEENDDDEKESDE